jgi:hypothetical protein
LLCHFLTLKLSLTLLGTQCYASYSWLQVQRSSPITACPVSITPVNQTSQIKFKCTPTPEDHLAVSFLPSTPAICIISHGFARSFLVVVISLSRHSFKLCFCPLDDSCMLTSIHVARVHSNRTPIDFFQFIPEVVP